MIVSITIFNSQVYFLGFFLWKALFKICSNDGIYSVGKDLVEQNTTSWQTESFASTSWVGLTRETLAKTSRLAWLFIFQACVLHVGFSQVSFSQDTHEIHLFILWSLSLHTLSHSSLTIKNSHTYREIWLKKLQSKLARN